MTRMTLAITASTWPALAAFVDPAALGIVLGGTAIAAVLRTESADLGRAIAALGVLPRRRFNAAPLLDQIDALGRIARKHGVMTLDRSVIRDADLAAAIAAIVDRADGDQVAALLQDRRRQRIDRHVGAADAWAGIAEIAPAMGMVGTLIGLVKMFAAMTDPAAIGGAMAIALLATLYGALVANLVAMPIATRLRRRAQHEAAERLRLIEPLVAFARREAPRGRRAEPAPASESDKAAA